MSEAAKSRKELAPIADATATGAAIREFRTKLGLTQVQFAAELGITPTSVYRYEAGTNSPTNDILAKVLQFAVKKQALNAVQNIAEMLSSRTGLNVLGGESGQDTPLAKAIAGLGLERQRLLMAAVLMLEEEADVTAFRVFEALLQPWINKATEAFGPIDVTFNAGRNEQRKNTAAQHRVKKSENILD